MRRFYLPDICPRISEVVELPANIQHHMAVLRLSPGTRIELFNGAGLLVRATLENEHSARVHEVQHDAGTPLRTCLIQGLPKGEKLDLILQKGTELGVSSFCLVEMERSVGRLKSEKREQRLKRWQRIVAEAARQCRQPLLPEVNFERGVEQALATFPAELKLLLWEEGSQSLSAVLPPQAVTSVSILVGPEGGISPGEAEMAIQAGFQPVRFGPRILRTETAGLAAMSVLQYLYGDLSINNLGSEAFSQGKGES